MRHGPARGAGRTLAAAAAAALALLVSAAVAAADSPVVGAPPADGTTSAAPVAQPSTPPAATPAGVAAGSTAGPSGAAVGNASAGVAGTPAAAPAGGADASTSAGDINKKEIQRTRPANGAPTTRPDGSVVEPGPTMDMGRVGLALSAVIGLILFLRWGSRKLLAPSLAGGSSHLMQVVARTPLAPRQQLLLVRVGQRLMVIGDSGGRLSGVGQIDDPDEVAAIVGKSRPTGGPTPAAAAFGGVFRRLSQGFGKKSDSADWDEEDEAAAVAAETAGRSERQRLLDTLAPHADGPGEPVGHRPGPTNGRATSNGTAAGYASETDAEAAVEAARADILALRAKLRAVTERLGGPTSDDATANADSPDYGAMEGEPTNGTAKQIPEREADGFAAGGHLANNDAEREPRDRRVADDPEA